MRGFLSSPRFTSFLRCNFNLLLVLARLGHELDLLLHMADHTRGFAELA